MKTLRDLLKEKIFYFLINFKKFRLDLYIVVKNTKEEYEAKIGYFQKQVAELKNEKENYSGIVKKQSSVSIILCSKCN